MSRHESTTRPAPSAQLHRTLSFWGAIGLSIAVLGPSMAVNINPQAPAGKVGPAVPLVFLVSTIAVLLVGYAFVRLCQQLPHTGSVYTLVAATLGPRAGFVAGWLLLGTYLVFAITTLAGTALFLKSFLDSSGVTSDVNWLLPAALAFLGLAVLATRSASSATKILLAVEAATMLAILAVSIVVLVRVATHHAPNGQHLDAKIFTLPDGVEVPQLFSAVTFGFLSFAGFEAATTLGEETHNPRRAIPRALMGAVIGAGLFFVLVTTAESLGFGTDVAGTQAFVSAPSLMGSLGTGYIGSWVGDLVTLGAGLGAFGSALACLVGSSRLLFTMGRDGFLSTGLAKVRSRDGVPMVAAIAALAVLAAGTAALRVFATANVTDIFFWTATIGALSLLLVYLLCLAGAVRFLFFTGGPRAPRWELAIPLAGAGIVGYTVYSNVVPVPASPYNAFPYLVGAWLLLGVLAIALMPGVVNNIGRRFADDTPAATVDSAGLDTVSATDDHRRNVPARASAPSETTAAAESAMRRTEPL